MPGGGLEAALETDQHLLELVAAECPSDVDRLPLDELDEVDQHRQPDIQRRGLQALPVAQLAGLVFVEDAVGNVADVFQAAEQAWTVKLAVEDVLNDATNITHCPPSDLLGLVTSGHGAKEALEGIHQTVECRAGLTYCGALSTFQSRCPPDKYTVHQHHSLYIIHVPIIIID